MNEKKVSFNKFMLKWTLMCLILVFVSLNFIIGLNVIIQIEVWMIGILLFMVLFVTGKYLDIWNKYKELKKEVEDA